MPAICVPRLLTPGKIAEETGATLPQVCYVLNTRRHIVPAARAGIQRVYRHEAIAQVRHELKAIEARRSRREREREGSVS